MQTADVPNVFQPFFRYGRIPRLFPAPDAGERDPREEEAWMLWRLPVLYASRALEGARISKERRDEEPIVATGYIDNPGFNACVRHEDESIGVCFFTGLPLVTFRACVQLARRLDFATGLPFVDDEGCLIARSDRIPLPRSWEVTRPLNDQILSDLQEMGENTTASERELATFLFDIAMRYVAMHEIMHVLLGHARYSHVHLGLDRFLDAGPERDRLPPMLSQMMEFIADRHTIIGLAGDLELGRLEHVWVHGTVPPGLTADPSVWKRRLLIATITCVSKLWAGHAGSRFANFVEPYPHPYERVIWMIKALHGRAQTDAHASDIIRTFTLNLANLELNFTSDLMFQPVIEEDLRRVENGDRSALDRGYQFIIDETNEKQRRLLSRLRSVLSRLRALRPVAPVNAKLS
jgi:hypothetical protein